MAKKEKTTVSNDADLGMQELVSELIESQDILYKELDSLFTSLDILIETLEQPAELLNGISEGFKEFFFESQGNVTSETTSSDPVIEKQEDNNSRVNYQDSSNVGAGTATAVSLQYTSASQADSQRDFIDSLLSPITKRLDAISGSIENTNTTLATSFKSMKSLLDVIAKPIKFVGGFFKTVFSVGGGGLLFLALSYFWDKVKDGWIGKLISEIGSGITSLVNTFQENWPSIKSILESVGTTISSILEVAENIIDKIKELTGNKDIDDYKKETNKIVKETEATYKFTDVEKKKYEENIKNYREQLINSNQWSDFEVEKQTKDYAKNLATKFKVNKKEQADSAEDEALRVYNQTHQNIDTSLIKTWGWTEKQKTEANQYNEKLARERAEISKQARASAKNEKLDQVTFDRILAGRRTEYDINSRENKDRLKKFDEVATTPELKNAYQNMLNKDKTDLAEIQQSKQALVVADKLQLKLDVSKVKDVFKQAKQSINNFNINKGGDSVIQSVNAQASVDKVSDIARGIAIGSHLAGIMNWQNGI